jgi:lectin-like protein
MRITVMCLALGAVASAGCLRSTQFKCAQDADCGATGVCEAVGFCSFPSNSCPGSGRSFGDSAGQGLSNTCVPGNNPPGVDAGVTIDAPVSIDGPPQGCPSPYAAVAGSAHLYKVLANVSWDTAASACKLTSASAYLAVPDDLTELGNLATVAMGTPFWVGIDDQAIKGTFVTQKNMPATYVPWATGQPDQSNPFKGCVNAISATEIATERCGNSQIAVCECEP